MASLVTLSSSVPQGNVGRLRGLLEHNCEVVSIHRERHLLAPNIPDPHRRAKQDNPGAEQGHADGAAPQKVRPVLHLPPRQVARQPRSVLHSNEIVSFEFSC